MYWGNVPASIGLALQQAHEEQGPPHQRRAAEPRSGLWMLANIDPRGILVPDDVQILECKTAGEGRGIACKEGVPSMCSCK